MTEGKERLFVLRVVPFVTDLEAFVVMDIEGSRRLEDSVERAGIIWIGPTARSIADMGDKERARTLAKAAGVPVLEGSSRFAPGELDGIAAAAESGGYPLLVKAAGVHVRRQRQGRGVGDGGMR